MTEPQNQRAGFAAIIGAPNAGKSTLVNRLTGTKVSIVTQKVQTTRFPVRGIAMEGDAQIVLGKGGQTLKWIGQKAREELSELLDRPVHLFLTVKVDPKWQDSRALYAQFGLDYDV